MRHKVVARWALVMVLLFGSSMMAEAAGRNQTLRLDPFCGDFFRSLQSQVRKEALRLWRKSGTKGRYEEVVRRAADQVIRKLTLFNRLGSYVSAEIRRQYLQEIVERMLKDQELRRRMLHFQKKLRQATGLLMAKGLRSCEARFQRLQLERVLKQISSSKALPWVYGQSSILIKPLLHRSDRKKQLKTGGLLFKTLWHAKKNYRNLSRARGHFQRMGTGPWMSLYNGYFTRSKSVFHKMLPEFVVHYWRDTAFHLARRALLKKGIQLVATRMIPKVGWVLLAHDIWTLVHLEGMLPVVRDRLLDKKLQKQLVFQASDAQVKALKQLLKRVLTPSHS